MDEADDCTERAGGEGVGQAEEILRRRTTNYEVDTRGTVEQQTVFGKGLLRYRVERGDGEVRNVVLMNVWILIVGKIHVVLQRPGQERVRMVLEKRENENS